MFSYCDCFSIGGNYLRKRKDKIKIIKVVNDLKNLFRRDLIGSTNIYGSKFCFSFISFELNDDSYVITFLEL